MWIGVWEVTGAMSIKARSTTHFMYSDLRTRTAKFHQLFNVTGT